MSPIYVKYVQIPYFKLITKKKKDLADLLEKLTFICRNNYQLTEGTQDKALRNTPANVCYVKEEMTFTVGLKQIQHETAARDELKQLRFLGEA